MDWSEIVRIIPDTSEAQAAIAAAFIAAFSALLCVVLTATSGWRGEMRAAFRSSLSPHLAPLSRSLHRCIACADIIKKKVDAGQDATRWADRGDSAAKELDEVRTEARYMICEVDAALNVIKRAPSWTATMAEPDPEGTARRLEMMDDLRQQVENCIIRSYRRGRPISWWSERKLRKRAQRIRADWDSRPTRVVSLAAEARL